LWFLCLFIIGAINLASHGLTVFQACNPLYAISFLYAHGYPVLGGILLAITGVEALFADLAHYSQASIKWTFTLVVYPSLLVTYLGQAASLIAHPEWTSNAFYYSIPGGVGTGVYWSMLALATAASVIGSQAMILGIFSIVRIVRWGQC